MIETNDTSVHESCANCKATRLTRRYRGLWLCINGPKCYRKRKRIHAVALHARKKAAAR